MEIRKLVLVVFLIGLVFQNCSDRVEYKGFFHSDPQVNSRFDDSQRWNDENPARTLTLPLDSFKILIAGDCQVGGTKTLRKFLSKLDNTVNAYFLAGDLTLGKIEHYDTFQKYVPNPIQENGFFVAGNHDLYFDGWTEYLSRFGSSSYTMVLNTPDTTDLFIFIESSSATLGAKQIEWLREVLENERHHHRNCIITGHTNMWRTRRTASTNTLTEENNLLTDLYLKHNVNYVFMGHDHEASIEILGPTTYVTLDALEDINRTPGYLEFISINGNIELVFKDL